jgi:hypothetical protein
VSKAADRDVGRFDEWAPVFDLDPLLPLRRRQPRPAVGRVPLVTAVIARRRQPVAG